MAYGLMEVIFVLGLVLAAGGYYFLKDAKSRKRTVAFGAAAALLVVVFGGVFGYAPLLSATPGGVPAPAAAGLWDGAIDAADSDTDTDRTETELLSPGAHSILWILSDANMDGLGDAGIEVDMYNLNVGKTTDIWSGDITLVKIGTVIVSGIPTPVANYTTDRSRFNVAYSEGTTFTGGDVVQVDDHGFVTATSKATESVVVAIPTDPTVADDLPAGGSFQLVFSLGGIVFTMTLQES